jgi:hypothetical protein
MGLAADDAQVERLRDAAIAGEIVGQHRLLEPVDVVVFELAAHWIATSALQPARAPG